MALPRPVAHYFPKPVVRACRHILASLPMLKRLRNRLRFLDPIAASSPTPTPPPTFPARDPVPLSELDVVLASIESDADEDRRRRRWHRVILDLGDLRQAGHDVERLAAKDPFSPEYAADIHRLLEHIAGQDIGAAKEGFPIDQDHLALHQFPYGGSPHLAGRFMIAYGFILDRMGLPPGARILEVGSGFGSLTYHLARMGYHVTCLEANQGFLDLTLRITRECPGKVVGICHDANTYEYPGPYDAVIFFESLHHLIDHAEVLRRIRKSLSPDGRLIIAGEPILDQADMTLPFPWGPRLEGESLRAIRRWGWTELGFTRQYFHDLLGHCGFNWERDGVSGNPWAQMYIARLGFGAIRPLDDAMLIDGWAERKPHDMGLAWALTESARIALPRPVAKEDLLVLRLQAASACTMTVHHDGRLVGSWVAYKPGYHDLVIPWRDLPHIDSDPAAASGGAPVEETGDDLPIAPAPTVLAITTDALRRPDNGDPRLLGPGLAGWRCTNSHDIARPRQTSPVDATPDDGVPPAPPAAGSRAGSA